MENNSHSYKVVIYNQTYSLRSDHGPDYIHELAAYVDKRMGEIDFLLVLQLRSRPAVRHAAATLSAAQRH